MLTIKTKVIGKVDLGIEKAFVSIPCPQCHLEEPVQMRDLLHENRFICRGCKSFIKPLDQFDEAKRQIKSLNKQLEQLFKGF